MKPVFIMGKFQPDDGEEWAFENNHRMVEWEEAVAWDYRTDEPIGWERRRCPLPLYRGRTTSEAERNVHRRVPNCAMKPASNGAAP